MEHNCFRYILYVLMQLLNPYSHFTSSCHYSICFGKCVLQFIQKMWLQCLDVIVMLSLLLLGANLFFSMFFTCFCVSFQLNNTGALEPLSRMSDSRFDFRKVLLLKCAFVMESQSPTTTVIYFFRLSYNCTCIII